MKATIENMKLAKEHEMKMVVVGYVQNARSKQPENVNCEITKVGKTCFYSGTRRYRSYFNAMYCDLIVSR